jgi:hypothetical protein
VYKLVTIDQIFDFKQYRYYTLLVVDKMVVNVRSDEDRDSYKEYVNILVFIAINCSVIQWLLKRKFASSIIDLEGRKQKYLANNYFYLILISEYYIKVWLGVWPCKQRGC